MAKLRTAFYFGDKLNTGEYDNGVWMNLLQIPFITKLEEAGNYDVIIRTLWIEATVQGWSREIRRRFPAVKQIGLSDHPLSTHISRMNAQHQIEYIKDLEALDGIMALTEEERQWYQTAVPSIPVVKTGLPFPFDTYNERYSTFKESERKYIGLGVGAADNDRNFISSFLVFKRLQLEYPDIIGLFLSVPQSILQQCIYLASQTKNVYIQERSDMSTFYDTLSQCKFVLNMADRNSPGRIQAEGAFFGVPVIGSNRLELQRELFPDLSVSPFDLEEAVNLSKYLLDNADKSSVFTNYALDKLQTYNYAKSKRKFNKLLNEVLARG